MNTPNRRLHVPFVALAGLSLLAALWAALARVGWSLPALPIPIVAQHGPLMIGGFLGTLIGLERATALRLRWAYAAPLLSGLGAIGLALGIPAVVGRGLITFGSLGLSIIFVHMLRMRPAVYVQTMGLGALAWLVGNAAWWGDRSMPAVVPWWAGFLILTIAGERLELARVLTPSHAARTAFVAVVGLLLIGLCVSLVVVEAGYALSGLGLIGIGAWLARHDIARRTIRQSGLTRFIAACLLPGYVWLIVGGGLWVAFGAGIIGAWIYDAMLHAVFLGFVLSMIFGHASIILPAVLPIDVTYRPVFYAHLALLHVSLAARIAGDVTGQLVLRTWGGLFNVIAVLVFLIVTARSAKRRTL